MDFTNITNIGKNEYVVETTDDLATLSLYAYVGSKAYCLADKKLYIQTQLYKWVSI